MSGQVLPSPSGEAAKLAGAAADVAGAASLSGWSARALAGVERALDALLPAAGSHPAMLHEAMRYAVQGGGKRVRPLLVHAAGELVAGAKAEALDAAACAVELIHAYSLVHDDLPCMDDDRLRRGKPTVWVAYGEACAMLVGDALQALAFESLARAPLARPEAVAGMVGELARAAGSRGMVGGQAIDLESVGARLERDALEDMHRRKTGALLRASVMLGAACGEPLSGAERERVERYAAAVGLAFQVVDDVLDVEGDTVTLGKTAGKDDHHDKPTYVSAIGLAGAKALAARLRDEAHAALEPFGARAQRLAQLADLIVLRKS